jgi:hypothetical protein
MQTCKQRRPVKMECLTSIGCSVFSDVLAVWHLGHVRYSRAPDLTMRWLGV